MAYMKCSGGAGGLKETLLWENASPTKSFAAQTITLSQGMSNFDFIKVICKYSATSTITYTYYFEVSNLMANTGYGINIGGTTKMSGNYGNVRTMSQYKSDTEIQFLTGHPWNSNDNSVAVPIYVYGVK